MQIYGDMSSEIWIASFASELLLRIDDAEEELESLRAILIGCGQLEQLTSEARGLPAGLSASAARATDHSAAAFYAVWARENAAATPADWQVAREIRHLRAHVVPLALAGTATGTLKVPEGFAFYALYPEQYCAAAVAYLNRRGRAVGRTHVIGLRSIGTALSAAVAAALKAAHVAHRRYTVRPDGHPFDRHIALPEPFADGDRALVVDEGPGLSGSSFFAAARALNACGVSVARQAYFCAHPHPPGAMASGEIRDFWQRAERYVASSHESALSAEGSLGAVITAELRRRFQSEVLRLEDISRGQWRGPAFGERAEWPAAHAAFERPKLLALLADGRRVLLKYYGQVLRADPVTRKLDWSDAAASRRVAQGGASVLRIHGYVARLWIDGELLKPADKSPALLEQLAHFLAGWPWQRTNGSNTAADAYFAASGTLAPGEWLRLPSGQIVKLPETLAGYDHTAIDAEPLGWDLAAAIAEWQLSAPEAEHLLACFHQRSGLRVSPADVAPHLRKYAAFSAEKARFCAGQADPREAARLEAQAVHYAAYAEGHAP